MLLISKNAGVDVQAISKSVVDSFLHESGYKPRMMWEQ